MSHHSCLCAPSLRCLSCLGEYGFNLIRILSFPSCLLKSRDEIFLRGENCHSPGKKRRKKMKIPRQAPPVSPSTLSFPCSARRRGRTRRRRRRPFSGHVPAIVVFRAALHSSPHSLLIRARPPRFPANPSSFLPPLPPPELPCRHRFAALGEP